MNFNQKKEFILAHTDEFLDNFFGVKADTELSYEGPSDLYLERIDPRALYTSYQDLIEVMSLLYREGVKQWCDIGCGIGRSCFLWTWLFDDTSSIGIEQVKERIAQARQNSSDGRMMWIEADFSSPDFKLPMSDVYYIYLSTGPRFDSLLRKLKKIQGTPLLVVVESHGDMISRLRWEGWWLNQTEKRFKLSSQRHHPWGMVFQKSADSMFFQLEESFEARSGIMPMELKKHPSPLSYILSKSNQKNWELVIEEEGEMWTMDTLGVEWFDHQSIKGINPPRQVSWDECTIGMRLIPEGEYSEWSKRRRLGTRLSFNVKDKRVEQVLIRKIFIQPEFILDLSDGSRVIVDELLNWEIT